MIGKWPPLQKKLADESYKTWGYEIEKEVDKPIVKKAGDEWR
jgi:hypothetical protein